MLAAAAAIGVAGVTLWPDPRQAASSALTPLGCLACGNHGSVDVILNLILFMPFGAGLALAGWPWRRAIAAAALLSLTVESLQFTAVAGRDASLSDRLSNTAGGAIGVWLGPRLPRAVLPDRTLAGALLVAGMACWLGLLALSAWLLAPGSSTGALASYWAPHGPEPNPFTGSVQSVALYGTAMPSSGTPPDTAALRAGFDRGLTEVTAAGASGVATRRGGWIFLVAAGTRPQLLLSQKRTDVYVAVPARAVRFKLRAPALTLSAAMPRVAGVPFQLWGGRQGHAIRLASSYAGQSRAVELRLSPSHGWALIAPFGFGLGAAVRLVTAACIAAVMLPLGYWGGSAGRPRWALLLLMAAVAGGLGLVPALGGYGLVHWSEWVAALAAAAVGWAVRRPAAYLQPRCASPSISVSSSS